MLRPESLEDPGRLLFQDRLRLSHSLYRSQTDGPHHAHTHAHGGDGRGELKSKAHGLEYLWETSLCQSENRLQAADDRLQFYSSGFQI